jgi:hypothetical protein
MSQSEAPAYEAMFWPFTPTTSLLLQTAPHPLFIMSNLELTVPISRRMAEITQEIEEKYASNAKSLHFRITCFRAKLVRDEAVYDEKEEMRSEDSDVESDDDDEEAETEKKAVKPNIKSPAYAPYSPRIDIRARRLFTI